MSVIQIPSQEGELGSESSKPPSKEPSPVQFDTVIEEEEPVEFEDQCDSQHLLERKTKSFRCLTQIIVSSSSFFRQLVYLFPPLEDPGINEAFEYVEPAPFYDDIGIEKYTDMCKELEIVPISRIIQSLPEETLDLKYYGLTNKQLKALTETLKINSHVKTLILQDNWMNPEMCQLLSNMIFGNRKIKSLILRECRIGVEGAEILSEALSNSDYISELDLSFNSLGDRGLFNLKGALADMPYLNILNLSHNNLTEESGVYLDEICRNNDNIEELDLSWNGFCTAAGNKKLIAGIRKNDTLRVLNLAWNGISIRPAITPIMRYVRKSENLEYLDLSNNRLEAGSLKATRTGILKNHSLKVVKVGNNCYSPEEAYLLAAMMLKKAKDPITHLDMENMYFNKNVLPALYRIKGMGKTITFGGILSNYKIYGPDIKKVLFDRCRFILQKPKKKKAKKDFGHFILGLPEDKTITMDEFTDLLKKKKMKKLDKDLIKELTNQFPARRQKIDVMEMRRVYMDYFPDTCLPPPKPKKKKKGKKGKGKAVAQEEPPVAEIPLSEQVTAQGNVFPDDQTTETTDTTATTETSLTTEADESNTQASEDVVTDSTATDVVPEIVDEQVPVENVDENSQALEEPKVDVTEGTEPKTE